METIDGTEYWLYDGNRYPTVGLSAVVGRTKEEFSPDAAPLLGDAPRVLRREGPH